MKNKTLYICVSALLFLCGCANKNTPETDKPEGKAIILESMPFTKGVNLSDWFLQINESYLTKGKYTDKDFKDLQSLGFEAVRLPIRFQKFTGPAPGYALSENFFEILDYAVDLAEKNGMYIILDNHSYFGADVFPEAYGQEQLTRVWEQIAAHFKDRSDKVIYEVMNEPGGTYLEKYWYDIQTGFLQTIRSIDKKHTVIVKGLGDSRKNLKDIPEYEDGNLIYSFHFYPSHLFTMQGATWISPSPTLDLESPIPFPYSADKMPAKPASFKGTEYDELYDLYPEQGTVEYLQQCLDEAVRFAAGRKVPVLCGEFGVVRGMAENEDRCRWYEAVSAYCEKKGIGWTMWDYRTDHSLFNEGNPIFEQNLNVPLLRALGLNVPAYYDSGEAPDLQIYDDVLATFAKNSSWNGADSETNSYWCVNYECKKSPFEGASCIEWAIPPVGMGASYCSLSFTFWPVADFTPQFESDYNVEFMVRCDDPVDKMYVRLVYYRNASTRAWRNVYEMGNNHPYAFFASDGAWHKISIPLKNFYILGNNDTDKWVADYEAYIQANPDQAWDWEHINKLEFATEGNKNLKGVTIYFDDIKICKPEE